MSFLQRWVAKRFYSRDFPLVRWILGALVVLWVCTVILRVWVNQSFFDSTDAAAGSIDEAVWRAIIESLNFAGLGKDELSNWPNRLVGLFSAFFGGAIVIFGIASLSAKLAVASIQGHVNQGELFLSGHNLILGFSEQAIDIVAELIEANRLKKRAVILLITHLDPDEVMERLREEISSFENSQIYCRKGSRCSANTLMNGSVSKASSVTLINPVQGWEKSSRRHEGDMEVQMEVLAIQAACKKTPPPVILSMHFKRNLQLAESIIPGCIFGLHEETFLAKMMAQIARNPDVGRIYSNLVGFAGDEFYFLPVPRQWVGKRFGEADSYFSEAIPVGLRYGDGTVEMGPPQDRLLKEGEELVILAGDESQLGYAKLPCIQGHAFAAAPQTHKPKPEHYLIYGWNPKTKAIIDEFASYLAEGSVVNIIVPSVTESIERKFKKLFKKYEQLSLGLGQVNLEQEGFLDQLAPERYKAVLFLSVQGDGAEAMDSVTFSLLLKFRGYFMDLEKRRGKGCKTQLLAELQRTKNGRLMQSAGINSLMVSTQVLSKILAQVAVEPGVLAVYQDLFQAEGCELYLKEAGLYFDQLDVDFHFADLVLAAQQRGEICIGVKLQRLNDNPEDDYGLFLRPIKSQSFWLTKGDQLIIFAQDEI